MDVERDPADDGGLLERVHHTHRHPHRVGGGRDVLQQDRELVAPYPRGRVGRAGRVLEPTRQDAQQFVPGTVPVRVVHDLEVVDVEVEETEELARSLRSLERVADPGLERRTVREPRDGTLRRPAFELTAPGPQPHEQSDDEDAGEREPGEEYPRELVALLQRSQQLGARCGGEQGPVGAGDLGSRDVALGRPDM